MAEPYLGPAIDPADVTPDLENVRNVRVGIGLNVKDCAADLAPIDGNTDLTPEGRAKGKAAVVAKYEEKLGYLNTVIEIEEKKTAKLEAETSGSSVFKTDSPAVAIQFAEIRSYCKTMERGALIALLHEAVRNPGDPDNAALIAANATAPGYMNLIPAEIRKALIDAVVAHKHPEKLAELERRRRVVAAAREAMTRAKEILSKVPRPVAARKGPAPVWETSDQALRDRFVVGDGSK